jgi:hypothetical protein
MKTRLKFMFSFFTLSSITLAIMHFTQWIKGEPISDPNRCPELWTDALHPLPRRSHHCAIVGEGARKGSYTWWCLDPYSAQGDNVEGRQWCKNIVRSRHLTSKNRGNDVFSGLKS